MKKLSFFNKIIFLVNALFAFALLFSFIIPSIAPLQNGVIAILSLLVPAFIFINIIFMIYWMIIGFKKQFLQSFIVLLLCFFFLPKLYNFNQTNRPAPDNALRILTYNVRKFNKYNWIKVDNVPQKITAFIESANADIVLLQEFEKNDQFKLDYPYSYNHYQPWDNDFHQSGLATYSKYPIVGTGTVGIDRVAPSLIYTDIVKAKDTIRVYNMHLESLGVDPNQDYLGFDKSENLLKRIRNSFRNQQREIDTLNAQLEQQYKTIIAGDMNNTAFSWAYKHIKGNYKDSFEEAGHGFGKTYSFKRFPLRIDYCFVDSTFTVNSHTNYDIKLSDHYPVMATISLD